VHVDVWWRNGILMLFEIQLLRKYKVEGRCGTTVSGSVRHPPSTHAGSRQWAIVVASRSSSSALPVARPGHLRLTRFPVAQQIVVPIDRGRIAVHDHGIKVKAVREAADDRQLVAPVWWLGARRDDVFRVSQTFAWRFRPM
jgi:hypothetical protein